MPLSDITPYTGFKKVIGNWYPNHQWTGDSYFGEQVWSSAEDIFRLQKDSTDSGLFTVGNTDLFNRSTVYFRSYTNNITLYKSFINVKLALQKAIEVRDANHYDGLNVKVRRLNSNQDWQYFRSTVGWGYPTANFGTQMTYEELLDFFNNEKDSWFAQLDLADPDGFLCSTYYKDGDGNLVRSDNGTHHIEGLFVKGAKSLSDGTSEDIFYELSQTFFSSNFRIINYPGYSDSYTGMDNEWKYSIPDDIFNRNDVMFITCESWRDIDYPSGYNPDNISVFGIICKKSFIDYIMDIIGLPYNIEYIGDEPGPVPSNYDCPTFWLGDNGSGMFPIYNVQEFWAGNTDSFIGVYSLNGTDAYNLGKSVNSILSQVTSLLPGMPTPQECILSFRSVPYEPTVEGRSIIMLGRYGTTNTEGDLVKLQYEPIDGGVVYIPPKYNSFLDYSPYTKVILHVPFYGPVQLETDIVMGRYIQIAYFVDNVTGAFKCFLTIYNEDPTIKDQTDFKILTTLEGSVGATVPLIYQDFSDMFSGMTSLFFRTATGSAFTTPQETINDLGSLTTLKAPIIPVSNTSPNGSYYDCRIAFAEIHRPNECRPESYAHDVGIPCNVTLMLQDLNGFTKVSKIHLDGVTCTSAEKDELLNLLTTGVIL